jgi:hypothetical protein
MIKLPPEQKSMHRPVKITADMLSLSLPRRIHAMPTPDKPLIIHQSELANFLRCRVKWHLRHQLRLARKGGAINLEMGLMFHAMKEAWYTLPWKKRTWKAMQRIARELAWAPEYKDENGRMKPYLVMQEDDRRLILAMAVNWAEWANNPENPHSDAAIGLRECFPEMEWQHALTPDKSILVRGRFDNPFKPAVYKRAMSCSESKTRSSFRDENLEMAIQLTVYCWAMREQWPKMKRYSIWFERSRKQMPGPRVKAALHDRVEIVRSDEEIEQWKIDTGNVVMDMLGAAIYPSPMDSCNYSCDYKGPCALRGHAAELKHVLRTQYEPKKEDER